MQQIPLSAVPSQSFAITLNGQNCNLTIYQRTTGLYFDMTFNNAPFTSCVKCLNFARLIADRQYLGFVGDFMFIDRQDASDPDYTGLGDRFVLVYLEAADLAAATDSG